MVAREETEFWQNRQRVLTMATATYNRRYNQNYNVQEVLNGIMAAAQQGQNISALPQENPLRYLFDVDMDLRAERDRNITERFDRWNDTYHRCLRGQSQVLAPEPLPRLMPGMGPGAAVGPGGPFMPGQMPGGGPEAPGGPGGPSRGRGVPGGPNGQGGGFNNFQAQPGGQRAGAGAGQGTGARTPTNRG